MSKCEISWVDPTTGRDTGDDNDAIGVVYREAYTEQYGPMGHVEYPETRCFNVCVHHAMRLNDVAMHRWHFVPFPLYVEHDVTQDYVRDRLATIADKWLSSQATVESVVDMGTVDDEDNDDETPASLPEGMPDPHDDETTTGDQDSDEY